MLRHRILPSRYTLYASGRITIQQHRRLQLKASPPGRSNCLPQIFHTAFSVTRIPLHLALNWSTILGGNTLFLVPQLKVLLQSTT